MWHFANDRSERPRHDSPERAKHDSPGQRPGFRTAHLSAEALKGRNTRRVKCRALSGLGECAAEQPPRALPWAVELRPFGAKSRRYTAIAFIVCGIALITLALGVTFCQTAHAQFGAAALDADPETSSADSIAQEKYPGGAPLKTVPEMERLLERAEQFVKDKRYDLAVVLWQKVLDESGDTLMTRDGRTYTSLAEEVERKLASLPPEGLRVYRITADGDAQGVLAAAGDEAQQRALAEIVRRYFVSSLGDDAAYKLGCMALDQYDFVGASRLFTKILEQHPDPTPARGDVLLRLAVATARVGDRQAAAAALEQLEKSTGPRPSQQLVELVKSDVQRAAGASFAAAGSSRDWTMSLGGPTRGGHMPALPNAVTASSLTKLWGPEFPLEFSYSVVGEIFSDGSDAGISSGRPVPSAGVLSSNSQQLIQRWRESAWMPSGQLLFAGDRVYFKTHHNLTCWNAAANDDKPLWRSAWQNSFELDSMSQLLAQMFGSIGMKTADGKRPTTVPEVLLFGDRVHQSMSIAGDVIYSVEGRQLGADSPPKQSPRTFHYGTVPRRTRRNWLAAYDAASGAARWWPVSPESADGAAAGDADVGFLAAPVPYGDLLLVPVTDGGALWLYALAERKLDKKITVETVWRTYLCDEPLGGCAPWSPVGVAVDGGDAYVVCGAGVVFAVNAATGAIRFAVRYPRSGKQSAMMSGFGSAPSHLLSLEGWDEDVAIPFGRALIVIASDYDSLLAIDRRDGKILWESPRKPFDHPAGYCLGVAGRGLFVGGKNVVRCYDIPSGRLVWERELENSFGRGVVTGDAVYVPVKDSVVKLDPQSGQVVSQVGVSLTSGEPVGNLFSDGEKLWVSGPNRFYALTNLNQRLQTLAAKIDAGDAAAQLDRMRLLVKLDRRDEAIGDLLGAAQLIRQQHGADAAVAVTLNNVSEIQMPQHEPLVALRILTDTLADLPGAPEQEPAKSLHDQRTNLATDALRTIQQKKVARGAAVVIRAVPLLSRDHQFDAASRALVATGAAADSDLLTAAIESSQPMVRLVAAEATSLIMREKAKPSLRKLLEDADPRVRFAAARALANAGDRDALVAFVKLLEADDPQIRSRSVQSLRLLTGKQIALNAYDSADVRATAVAAWQEWLAAEGATAKLNFPLPDVNPQLGRTLIAYYSRNLIVELDSLGTERWKKESVPGPWACQGLPNGHRLVALYTSNTIVEYDDAGKEVWKKDSLPGNPFSVQRLADGNTLTACSNGEKVLEIRPDGSIAWEATVRGRPMDARRLENGNTLVALVGANKVVEIDRAGKEVWQAGGLNGPISAQRLENDNTLVVQMNNGQVTELDRSGRPVWSKTGLTQPYQAQRLPNGNTLIADNNGVQEVNAQGTVVWQHRGSGASGVSRY
jgi:outer membrane protein assembly factor BamB